MYAGKPLGVVPAGQPGRERKFVSAAINALYLVRKDMDAASSEAAEREQLFIEAAAEALNATIESELDATLEPYTAPVSLESLAADESQQLKGDVSFQCGVTIAFPGENRARFGAIRDAAISAGFTPPTAKRDSTQFARACDGERSKKYVVRKVSDSTHKVVALTSDAVTGESAGDVVLVATLDKDGTCSYQSGGAQYMFQRIEKRYAEYVAEGYMKPGDVTGYIATRLVADCKAVKRASGHYVGTEHSERAVTFVKAVKAAWAENTHVWDYDKTFTGADFLNSLAAGIAREVEVESAKLESQIVAAAKKKNKDGTPKVVGQRALDNAMDRVTVIIKKAKSYAHLIGSARIRQTYDNAMKLRTKIQQVDATNAEALKAKNLWDEILWDKS
jgi:hypothetical protein